MATDDTQAARLRRIKYMLDRAASNADDAEQCRDMAQRLMTRHAITEAMLPGRDVEVADVIELITLEFTGIYAQVERDVALKIADANGCRAVLVTPSPRSKVKTYGLEICGWRTDLLNVQALNASVQLQCKMTLERWVREQPAAVWGRLSASDKFKDRREFIASFGLGLYTKLVAARDAAKEDVATERATETGESVQEASSGVDLALRGREDSVKDWYDDHYGDQLRTVRTRRVRGGTDARVTGWTAGRTADTGQTRVGGGSRAIGPGA